MQAETLKGFKIDCVHARMITKIDNPRLAFGLQSYALWFDDSSHSKIYLAFSWKNGMSWTTLYQNKRQLSIEKFFEGNKLKNVLELFCLYTVILSINEWKLSKTAFLGNCQNKTRLLKLTIIWVGLI